MGGRWPDLQLWLLSIFLFLSCVPHAFALQKYAAPDSTTESERPLCNDGTVANYYMRSGIGGASGCWVIYVEGGGFCDSDANCATRFQATPEYGSSSGHLATLTGATVLSTDASVNPTYYSCNHVYIPYCSSDFYTGKSTSATAAGYRFNGHGIFRTIITELVSSHSLGSASGVTLVGSSAGGLGLIAHAYWVANLAALSTQRSSYSIHFILDSCFFATFNSSLTDTFHNQRPADVIGTFWSGDLTKFCDGGATSCSTFDVAQMLATEAVMPANLPVLVITALYDAYMLVSSTPSIIDTDVTSYSNNQALEEYMRLEHYGGKSQGDVLALGADRYSISLFVTSCFQHQYLLGVSEGATTLETQLGNVKLKYTISEDVWKSTQSYGHTLYCHNSGGTCQAMQTNAFQSRSLASSIREWSAQGSATMEVVAAGSQSGLQQPDETGSKFLRSFSGALTATVLIRSHYSPDCKGALCQSTCPTVMAIDFSYDSDPAWLTGLLKAVLTIFCLMMGILLLLGCFMYVYHLQFQAVLKQQVEAKPTRGLSAVPVEVAMGVSWKKLDYWAPNGFPILHKVSGYINPGCLMAMMGPSGSGKTTMLDVIAGRRSDGFMEGSVLVDGKPRSDPAVSDHFKKNCGYMLQLAEAFCPQLTLRENLAYSAMMRLPADLSVEAKMERVEQVIDEIGMRRFANTVVGGAMGGGLSGGQKRLLMFGIEILSAPAILFLDEPTSGLDSVSSLQLITTLKNYCATGRSAVLTIHQPRQEIFSVLDQLLLLYRGSVAFFGPPLVGAKFLIQYASTVERLAVKLDSNPGDAVLDILSLKQETDGEGDEKVPLQETIGGGVVSFFYESGVIQDIGYAIDECVMKESANTVVVSNEFTLPSRAGICMLWTHIWTMNSRALSNTSTAKYFSCPILFIAMAIVISTLFGNPEKIYVLTSTFYKIHAISCGLITSGIVEVFFAGLVGMYMYENLAGCCSPFEYLTQKIVQFAFTTVVFGQLWFSIPVMLASYDFNPDLMRFGVSIAFFTMGCQAIIMMFIMFCSAFRLAGHTNHNIALILCASLETGVFGTFGGVYISPQDMPIYWRWLGYISPTYYVFAAVLRVNLDGYSLDAACDETMLVSKAYCLSFNSGASTLKNYGYEDLDVGVHFLYLFCLWIGFAVLAWLFMSLECGAIKSPFRCYSPTIICSKHPHEDLLGQEQEEEPASKYAGGASPCTEPASKYTLGDSIGLRDSSTALKESLKEELDAHEGYNPIIYWPGDLAPTRAVPTTLIARRAKVMSTIKGQQQNFNQTIQKEAREAVAHIHEAMQDAWMAQLTLNDEDARTQAQATFDMLNTNIDGTLTLDINEFMPLSTELGLARGSSSVVDLFQSLEDQEGLISRDRFCDWFVENVHRDRVMLEAASAEFDNHDKDMSGSICTDEFSSLLASVGVAADAKRVADLLSILDHNQDTTIDKAEFLNWFMVSQSSKPAESSEPKLKKHKTASWLEGTWEIKEGVGKGQQLQVSLDQSRKNVTVDHPVHGVTTALSSEIMCYNRIKLYGMTGTPDKNSAKPPRDQIIWSDRLQQGVPTTKWLKCAAKGTWVELRSVGGPTAAMDSGDANVVVSSHDEDANGADILQVTEMN